MNITNADWNTLMFLVEAIEQEGYEFVIFKDEVELSKDNGEFILSAKNDNKIEAVKDAIQKFIKWDYA
ncbi:MAG: hypothetical protein HC917_24945 [Richelia sp. SM2_1_7]|nr:hypothetical protein [Richelia sp. SM2_1_7]